MPRRRTLGVQVFLDGGPVDSQLPLGRSKRHPLAPGFLNRLPSLPLNERRLKERRLVRRGGFGFAGCGRDVSNGPLILLFRRFCRWRDRGVWARLLDAMIDDPDFEWLMIDASYIKVHPHSAGARGGNQAIARTKGGSTPSCTWRWMPTECR